MKTAIFSTKNDRGIAVFDKISRGGLAKTALQMTFRRGTSKAVNEVLRKVLTHQNCFQQIIAFLPLKVRMSVLNVI